MGRKKGREEERGERERERKRRERERGERDRVEEYGSTTYVHVCIRMST